MRLAGEDENGYVGLISTDQYLSVGTVYSVEAGRDGPLVYIGHSWMTGPARPGLACLTRSQSPARLTTSLFDLHQTAFVIPSRHSLP